MPLLAYILYERRGTVTKKGARSLYISIKNRGTQTEKGKFIYKALTLPGKQLLLKRDQLQSYKSAV